MKTSSLITSGESVILIAEFNKTPGIRHWIYCYIFDISYACSQVAITEAIFGLNCEHKR